MSRTDVNTVLWIPKTIYYDFNGSTSSYTGDADFVSEARSGFTTPGFGKKKKLNRQSRGSMQPLPFFYSRKERRTGIDCEYSTTETSDPFYYERISGWGFQVPGWSPPPTWTPDLDEKESLKAQNIQKVLGKLKDSKVNLAQVFAERKMTADLIAVTAKRLADSFLSLKKGDIKGAARALGQTASRSATGRFNKMYKVDKWKAAANGWLELKYGWEPLLQDVVGSAEWLASKQSHELRGVARSKIRLNHKNETSRQDSSGITILERTSGHYDSSLVISYVTTGVELADLKECGMLNPALLAWELLPYSFVVDWFIPVGDFLSSLDATVGLTFDTGSFTYFLDTRANSFGFAHQVIVPYATSTGVLNCNVRGSDTYVSVQREVFFSFPGPQAPQFKNPFSFGHAANAIALLTQTFKR